MSHRRLLLFITVVFIAIIVSIITFYYSNHLVQHESILPLDEFIIKVTKKDGDGYVYVRLNLALELNTQQEMNAVQEQIPKVRDAIYNYIYSLSESDLNKSSAIYFLREKITWRLNKVLSPIRINNVLFNDFIVG